MHQSYLQPCWKRRFWSLHLFPIYYCSWLRRGKQALAMKWLVLIHCKYNRVKYQIFTFTGYPLTWILLSLLCLWKIGDPLKPVRFLYHWVQRGNNICMFYIIDFWLFLIFWLHFVVWHFLSKIFTLQMSSWTSLTLYWWAPPWTCSSPPPSSSSLCQIWWKTFLFHLQIKANVTSLWYYQTLSPSQKNLPFSLELCSHHHAPLWA